MRPLPLLVSVVLSALLAVISTPAHAASRPGPVPAGHGAWPLAPRPEVVRGFDPPDSQFGPGHRGVDLLGRPGQAVHASLAGTVTFAATLAGRGVVVVDHGGFRTTYEPVAPGVAAGAVVSRDTVVGTLQRSGSHCFPRTCLHWGLHRVPRLASSYLDPLVLVGAGPVRLLPLDGGLVAGPLTIPAPPSVAGPRASHPVLLRLPRPV